MVIIPAVKSIGTEPFSSCFVTETVMWVSSDFSSIWGCQEQIDLSGFVAHELSAFSGLEWSAI